jgi:hypothetical protein
LDDILSHPYKNRVLRRVQDSHKAGKWRRDFRGISRKTPCVWNFNPARLRARAGSSSPLRHVGSQPSPHGRRSAADQRQGANDQVGPRLGLPSLRPKRVPRLPLPPGFALSEAYATHRLPRRHRPAGAKTSRRRATWAMLRRSACRPRSARAGQGAPAQTP